MPCAAAFIHIHWPCSPAVVVTPRECMGGLRDIIRGVRVGRAKRILRSFVRCAVLLLLVVTIFLPARYVAMAVAGDASGCACPHAIKEDGTRKKCCCTHADDGTRITFDQSCPCGAGVFVPPEGFGALIPVPVGERVGAFTAMAAPASHLTAFRLERPPRA
jgi:hypothetical protein